MKLAVKVNSTLCLFSEMVRVRCRVHKCQATDKCFWPKTIEQRDKFEERFRALHEDKFYPYEDSIGTLSTLINVELPEMPVDIVNLFSKTRSLIRLKKLNNNLTVLKKKYKKQYQNHVNKF